MINNTIKVSVISPIYNVEKYIEECIDSVRKQTLKEIEIICVNDGSTDGTQDIIENISKYDDRIRVINKKNEGPSAARNTGLDIAMGEYIYFIDSDDLILPDTLESLYNIAKNNKLDIIYFDADSFFETSDLHKKEDAYLDYYHRKQIYDSIYTGQELFELMLNNYDFKPSPCLQMLRRNLLSSYQINFYHGIIHEDNLFTLQTMMVSKRVMHLSKRFYLRRIHDNSIMTSEKGLMNAWGYYKSCDEMLNTISKIEVSKTCFMAIENYLSKLMRNAENYVKKLNEEIVLEETNKYSNEEQLKFLIYVYEQAKIQKKFEMKIEKQMIEINNLRQEVYDCRTCNSFRIGRAITYLPRRIKGISKLIKEKGIHYSWYRFSLKFSYRIRVSIIIPVYNAEKYLKPCLESLIHQTLGQIEIICVNDGSTDSSENILKEFSERDKRIKVISQENNGAGVARNTGMNYAKGDYLLFLDADDTFDRELCNLAYYRSKITKAQICMFGARRYDMENKETIPMTWVLRGDELPENNTFSSTDVKDRIFQITSACPWSKLFNREFILKNNLKFQNIKNSNDVLFVRMACTLAEKIIVLNQPLVTYRWKAGDNTQSLKSKAPTEFYKAFRELKEQLIQKGLYGKVEKSYVNLVLSESLYNLRTAGSEEAQKIVKNMLINEAFEYFELNKFEKDYFYNNEEFEQYCDLIKIRG